MSSGRQYHHRYYGIFTLNDWSTFRAYFVIISFIIGVVLITTGGVLCSVIARHPLSGGRRMHTPPLSLALFLIGSGVGVVMVGVVTLWRYGMEDDTEENAEDFTPLVYDDDVDDEVMKRYIEQKINLLCTSNPELTHHFCSCQKSNQCLDVRDESVRRSHQKVVVTKLPYKHSSRVVVGKKDVSVVIGDL